VSELKDFQFDSKSTPEDFETGPVDRRDDLGTGGGPGRGRIALVVAAVVILVAATVWFVRRGPDEPAPPSAADQATPAPESPDEPETEAEPEIELPELAASDAIARELVGALSAHPRLAAWLATDDLVRRFTASVVNIAEGQTPKPHLSVMSPSEPFSARYAAGTPVPTTKSYSRYDTMAEIVAGLDVEGTARLYRQLKPLIDEAFAELGYPGEDFHQMLIRALDHLLAAPSIEADVALEETVAAYQYADPELETLSAAQKQLLRMGPDNARRIQSTLRALRRELLQGSES
jgi:hypothetical protein